MTTPTDRVREALDIAIADTDSSVVRELLRKARRELDGMGWQPIETLKDCQDDNFFIANFDDKPSFIAYGWKPYDYNGKWIKYTGGQLVGVHNLTHWMPLTDAPYVEGEKE